MQSGKLKHSVEIQFPSHTEDASGDPVLDGWTTFATVWAFVKPLSGREIVQAQQLHAETNHSISLRFMKGINTSQRVLFNGKAYSILSVINTNEANEELILMTVKRD